MSARYAVYFVPADDSGLAGFGNEVLGRDALARPVMSSRQDHPLRSALAAGVSRYGFHATLKAPFERRVERTEQALADAVEHLASTSSPILLSGLAPSRMDRHLVLRQRPDRGAVQALARRCVVDIEPFRLPNPADVERRMAPGLSEQQGRNLRQFGYAAIFDDFRFHMTLGGPLPGEPESMDRPGTPLNDYLHWVQDGFDAWVPQTPVLDRLALCHQPSRTADFIRLHEWTFSQN